MSFDEAQPRLVPQNQYNMARHICTNCATTTATLYKVYSTPGSIQLTTCRNCGRDVDPYIEREWLLVIIDCVLHRPEAFRHVLYNREPFCDFGASEKSELGNEKSGGKQKDDDNHRRDPSKIGPSRAARSSGTSSFIGVIQYSMMASLLRTPLWNVNEDADRENLAPETIISLVQAIVGEVALVLTTILSSSLFVKHAATPQMSEGGDSETTGNDAAVFFYSRLHLALTIPVFFHVATRFALIWDDSSTVRLLGALIVLSLQCMGVAVVMEERVCRDRDYLNKDARVLQQKRYMWMYLSHASPFIIGLVVRTLFVYATSNLLVSTLQLGDDQACNAMVLL